ncbi:hypothetical protein [Yoonia sp. 208BN28-4]
MQMIAQGYRGVSVLVELNWDRLLTTATIVGSLYAASYIVLL